MCLVAGLYQTNWGYYYCRLCSWRGKDTFLHSSPLLLLHHLDLCTFITSTTGFLFYFPNVGMFVAVVSQACKSGIYRPLLLLVCLCTNFAFVKYWFLPKADIDYIIKRCGGRVWSCHCVARTNSMSESWRLCNACAVDGMVRRKTTMYWLWIYLVRHLKICSLSAVGGLQWRQHWCLLIRYDQTFALHTAGLAID